MSKIFNVACDSARRKGTSEDFDRVWIPTWDDEVGVQREYLLEHYDCKEPIVVTELFGDMEKGDEHE